MGPRETKLIAQAIALNNGGLNRLNVDFPTGEGWENLELRFNLVVVIGTGTGAISEGELRYLRNIFLKTDRGELIVNNCPGRFIYKRAQALRGTAGEKDAIAAASATYVVPIPILFSDPRMKQEDIMVVDGVPLVAHTMLDTSRYGSLELLITLGSVADLFSTVGTSTVATNVDIIVTRRRGILALPEKPSFYVELGVRSPVNVTTATEINLERIGNMSYKRAYLFAGSSGDVALAFSGDASNTIIDQITVDDEQKAFEDVIADMLRRENRQFYSLETLVTGFHVLDYVKDGELRQALYSGDKPRLKAKWTNLAGLPATPIVSLGYEAVKPLL